MGNNQVQELIIKANNQLEAHNFEEADRICKKAIKLDYNNPNIYLIQLLAEYKVTEIEDLENCDIDFNSDNYRKVRYYADQELNNELDKYLINKYAYKTNKPKNQIIIADTTSKKLELVTPEKELSNERDYYASLTTFVTIIGFSFLYFIMLVCLIGSLSKNKSISDFISIGTIASLFIYNLFKVYKKDVTTIPYPDSKSFAIYNTINYFVTSLVLFLFINIIVFVSCSFVILDDATTKVIGLILGSSMTLTIPYLYKQIYAFIKTTNLLIQDFFKKE